MQTFFDNQLSAIEKLRRYRVGALFMEPGTGKTRTALELVKSTDADLVLWLTPCRTADNLAAEIQKWGGLLNLHILGIETVSMSTRRYLDARALLSGAERAFILVDESLKIKNWEALRTRRILSLGQLATYRLILNGTPLSRNILDLWAQMEFLSPKILSMSLPQFKNTYCEWVRKTKYVSGRSIQQEWITKHHNVDHLYSKIGHYVYECDLDLSSRRQYIELEYTVDHEARERYKELKDYWLSKDTMDAAGNNVFLSMVQTMQQSYCVTEEKFTRLAEVLRVNDPTKVIVFTKFVASRDAIAERYPNLTVLSYGMHAFGLNLQDHNVTVFWDKTWDFAQREQAERRTWRAGQQMDCIYYDFTARIPLDGLINRNVEAKTSLLEYVKRISKAQLQKEL